MSSCKKFEDMIESYIDNELTTEEKELMNVHLDSCSSCREKLEFAKALRIKIKEIPIPELPHNFLERVNEAIDSEEVTYSKAKNFRRFFSTRAMQSIAACLLIAAFLGINNNLTDNINKLEEEDFKPVPTQGLVQGELSTVPVPTVENTPIVEGKNTSEPKKTAKSVKKATPIPTQAPETTMYTIKMEYKNFESEEAPLARLEQEEPQVAAFNMENEEAAAYSGEAEAIAEDNIGEVEADNTIVEDKAAVNDEKISIPSRARAGLPGSAGAVSGGGSGGGSSAATVEPEQEETKINGKLIVPKKMLDTVRGIAMKYGGCSDWNYSMTLENYKEFLAELKSAEIDYNADFETSEIVIFKIEH